MCGTCQDKNHANIDPKNKLVNEAKPFAKKIYQKKKNLQLLQLTLFILHDGKVYEAPKTVKK